MANKENQVVATTKFPAKGTYAIVEGLMKSVLNNFYVVFIAFFIVDYLVHLWDTTSLASSWRSNSNAEKVRDGVDHLFGFQGYSNGTLRFGITALTFAFATYYSVRRWGISAIALSGPVSVFILALVVKIIFNLANRPVNGEIDCEFATNNSWGNATLCYIDSVNRYMYLGDRGDNDNILFIMLGSFIGFLLAAK